MTKATAAAALLILACDSREPDPEPQATPEPAPASADESAPEPEPEVVYRATFRSSSLASCDEYRATDASAPPGALAALVARADEAGVAAVGDRDRRRIEIDKPCVEQFPNHTPLTTCVLPLPDVEWTQHHYLWDAFDSDAFMLQCMENDGEWTSVPKDSTAARNARIADLERQIEGRR